MLEGEQKLQQVNRNSSWASRSSAPATPSALRLPKFPTVPKFTAPDDQRTALTTRSVCLNAPTDASLTGVFHAFQQGYTPPNWS